MEDISENETCITISSDNCSPIKTDKEPLKGTNDHSIILSDTELEEGEISDGDEEEIKDNEFHLSERFLQKDIKKSPPTVESHSNSDVCNVKRKLSDDCSEVNKKGRFDETLSDSIDNDLGTTLEEFQWSELRVLVAGDERVKNLDWKEWNDLPFQELSFIKHGNLEALCNLVEKNLGKEYDVVFLCAFHHDFVTMNDSFFSDKYSKILMDLKSDVNIIKILSTVQKYHSKWERQFPNTFIIWTLPYPPDFFKFNTIALKGRNKIPVSLDEKSQNELSKNYYALAKKFLKEWKVHNKAIPIFPLNKVLFIKKHCYKKSFEGKGSPKFPKGYLIDGLYPSKMMILYIAYLLIEFLVDYEFYPENKYGLDLKILEQKLEEIDPLYKTYLHSDRINSSSHTRSSRRYSHHSHKSKRHNSLSPTHKSSRSHSQTRRRKSRSISKHHRIQRSSPKRKRKSHSRTRSSSRQRKEHSNSASSRRSSSKSKYSNTNKRLSSYSPSLSSSSESLSFKNKNHVPNEKKEMESKEEVSFFKTLRYLREVHEIQCALYRCKPHTHPLYTDEKEKFMKRQNSKLPLHFYLPKWHEYWKQKMEKFFEETWRSKKEQLAVDLNKKVTYTSLHNYPPHNNNGNSQDTSSCTVDTKHSKEESNFLKDWDTKLPEKNRLALLKDGDTKLPDKNRLTHPKESKEFTLADIFKESVFQNQDYISKNNSHKLEVSNTSKNFDAQIHKNSLPEKHELDTSASVKSDSDNGSLLFDDSDLDVDEIMENPDFLQGLEEIDRELQNALPIEESKTETFTSDALSSVPASSSPIQSDLSFLFKNKINQTNESSENLKAEFVNVLKMIFRVSKRLGPLGLSVSALYHRASEDLKSNKEIFPSMNSDSKALLVLVEKKLNSFLKENLPQVQKAIYGEISERVHSLLEKVNILKESRFSKVNILSIAAATVGQQLSDVISFIKNTLLYHGYAQFTNDDVMNIYMSVKASQIDMEKT